MTISERLWNRMIRELTAWMNGGRSYVYSPWVQARLDEAYTHRELPNRKYTKKHLTLIK